MTLTVSNIHQGFRLVVHHHGNHLTVHVGGSGLFGTHQGKKLPEKQTNKQKKEVYKTSVTSQLWQTVTGLVTYICVWCSTTDSKNMCIYIC